MTEEEDPTRSASPPDVPQAPARREVRFGPFVYVSGFRNHAGDPWAHRRGEPRFFALFWSIYLMLSALVTIFASRAIGVPLATRFRYGAAALLLLVCIGAIILWPLTRLSQRAPRHPARATGADLLVILVPMQAVVWPMPILTGWPLPVVGALALVLGAWTLLIGGFVLWGSASRSHADRVMWMIAAILCAFAAPAWYAWIVHAAPPGADPDWILRWSPLTAIYTLTQAPGNQRPVMSNQEWTAAAAALLPASILWLAWAIRTLAAHASRRAAKGGQTPA